MKKTVVVGMSGGVDSSVSALLLKRAGYEVIGLFMKNWEELDENGVCKSAQDYNDVIQVCQTLEIPYYSINFVEEYRDAVFAQFVSGLKKGLTPNPDILCNREIKFKVFLEKAKDLGADFFATGHYCQLDSWHRLLKGADPDKDQSYFLYAVEGSAFQKVLFPIGHLQKKEVRKIAKEAGLSTSEKKDSTGICFIGKRDFKSFMSQYLAYQPGPFKTLDGTIVGRHDGAAFYTIGQRKGMGLGGEGDAWYVIEKDMDNNTVFVERGEHPALFSSRLIANEITWIQEVPSFPLKCSAKVRYRQINQTCTVHAPILGNLQVDFDEPQRAVTPGQSIVFYDGEICLGGGIIMDRFKISPDASQQIRQ